MPTTGRFGKLRTLAGRVLRRGPVGPEPVQRRAPLPMAPKGECTARWCMAHDHGPRPGLAASRAQPVPAIAHEAPAAVLAQASVASAHESGTAMEMPLGQGVRALLAKMEPTTAELDASVPPEHDAETTPNVASVLDAETTPNVATVLDAETTPNVASGHDDATPGAEPAPTRDAAATDDRARDSRDRPALIPEILPPAAPTA